MTPVDQTFEDLEACDQALHELVSAIIAYDDVTAPALDAGKAIKVTFVGAIDPDRASFDGLVRHPVRHALREGIKRTGREIHRLGGGTHALIDSIDRVSEMDATRHSRRAAVINSAWSGIGSGDDRWWS